MSLTKNGWRLTRKESGAGMSNDLGASAAADTLSRPQNGLLRPPGKTGSHRLLFPDIAPMGLLDVSTEQGSSNAFEEAPKEAMTKKR